MGHGNTGTMFGSPMTSAAALQVAFRLFKVERSQYGASRAKKALSPKGSRGLPDDEVATLSETAGDGDDARRR